MSTMCSMACVALCLVSGWQLSDAAAFPNGGGGPQWSVNCTSYPHLSGDYLCFNNVNDFMTAIIATIPTGGGVDCASEHCKLALICNSTSPCKIPDDQCISTGGPCIFVARQMNVFMANVVIGPHTTNSAGHLGLGGGLLFIQDLSTFTAVNTTFTGGTAESEGGGITLEQGKFACKGCTFSNNTAEPAPWGPAHGGAINNFNQFGSVVLETPTFRANVPSVVDDCKFEGCCPQTNSSDCSTCNGGPLRCCVCSGEGCPKCCVPPETPLPVGCRGFASPDGAHQAHGLL